MQNVIRAISHLLKNNFRFLKLVWNVSKIQFLIKLFFSLITSLLPAATIWLIQFMISIMEHTSEQRVSYMTIFAVIVGFFAVQLVPQLINLWNSMLNSPKFMWQIKKNVSIELMNKAKDLDYSCFENEEFYNKYTHGMSQVDSISYQVFNEIFAFFSAIVTLISIISLIAFTDYIVLLFSLAAVAITFVLSSITARINNKNEEIFIPLTRYANYVRSLLFESEYAGEVRCNDITTLCKTKYINTTDDIISLSKKAGRKQLIITAIFTILKTLCDVGLYGFVMLNVVSGHYTIAAFSLLTNSAGQVENALNGFAQTISNVFNNSLKIDNLLYILDYTSDSKKCDGDQIDDKGTCSVEFSHVSFRYPNSEDYALKDASFSVNPGEKIAIVGENGSGKTTLVKLLLKLYLPESGEIKINGISIYELNDDDYRSKIGVAFQDYKIFDFTINENIDFGEKANAVTREYAEKIGVNDIISRCCNGWDTVLSKRFAENGTLLSGGEKQKIALLRALSKKAFMYILDEPSAALDPKSEYSMNKLSYSIKDKTMFITSHRLSSTAMADRIFFFEKGRLLENGTHSELISLSGKYAELFTLQADNYIQKA